MRYTRNMRKLKLHRTPATDFQDYVGKVTYIKLYAFTLIHLVVIKKNSFHRVPKRTRIKISMTRNRNKASTKSQALTI